MGLLSVAGGAINTAQGAINGVKDFLANPFKKTVPNTRPKPDFPEGFTIMEYVDGQPLTKERIALVGSWLPMVPFPIGGKQRIVKDYYPGNSEPVVHVLGPEETDLTIRGKLDAKKFGDLAASKLAETSGETKLSLSDARQVATELQQQLDAIRIRGNLLQLNLGEWRRYGFLEEAKFEMETLSKVKYELTFSIVGFNPPKNANIVDGERAVPFDINKTLIASLATFQSTYSSIPSEIPQSIADVINGVISDIADVVSTVTGFVDSTLGAVEDVGKAINRAIGVVDYAISSIYRARQRLGRINFNASYSGGKVLFPGIGNPFANLPVPHRYTGAAFITAAASGTLSLTELLQKLRDQFAKLRETTPQARHRVKADDTLQSLAVQYFNDVGQWEKIYEHNNLTTTILVVGSVLEIPRA